MTMGSPSSFDEVEQRGEVRHRAVDTDHHVITSSVVQTNATSLASGMLLVRKQLRVVCAEEPRVI
jgi:hypothetical protein